MAKPVVESKTLWQSKNGRSNPPRPSGKPQMVGDRMAGRPDTVIREIGLGKTVFMPDEGRRAAQDEVRASVVAMKRSNARGAKGTQEGGKMDDRNTEDKPTRVPARANRWWNWSSAIGLIGTERLTDIFGDRAKSRASFPIGKPLTGKPDAGKPPVRFGGRGGQETALPTPIPISLRRALHSICSEAEGPSRTQAAPRKDAPSC